MGDSNSFLFISKWSFFIHSVIIEYAHKERKETIVTFTFSVPAKNLIFGKLEKSPKIYYSGDERKSTKWQAKSFIGMKQTKTGKELQIKQYSFPSIWNIFTLYWNRNRYEHCVPRLGILLVCICAVYFETT